MRKYTSGAVILALVALVSPWRADGAACNESPTGQWNCESNVNRDQSSADKANFVAIRPNDTALTTDPTCANAATWSGLAQGLALTDIAESGTHTWGFCDAGLGAAGSFTAGTVTLPTIVGNSAILGGMLNVEIAPHLHIAQAGSGIAIDPGVTSPGDGLLISNQGATGGMRALVSSDTATHAPHIVFTRTRGTLVAPTIPSQDDLTAYIKSQSADGSAERDSASVEFYIDGATAVGQMPGRIVFKTTPTGGGSPTERLRINSAGSVIATSNFTTPKLIATANTLLIYPTTDATTAVQFAKADGATMVMTVDTTNKRVGVGTTAPSGKVHASIDGSAISGTFIGNENVLMSNESGAASARFAVASATATHAGLLNFSRARGTLASPTAVSPSDLLGGLYFRGFDTTVSQKSAASVEGYVDGTVSSGVLPGRLKITTQDASGVSAQRLLIDGSGSVVIGDAATALATSATKGFLYLPTCAGTPTGNSTDYAGTLPMVYDSTNNKLCINTTGTTWVCTAALS